MKLTAALRLLALVCIVWLAAAGNAAASTIRWEFTEYGVGEGGGIRVKVIVDRTGDPDEGAIIRVRYRTLDGSAKAAPRPNPTPDPTSGEQDYNSAEGELTFDPGIAAQELVFTTLEDERLEDTEDFRAILFSPSATNPDPKTPPNRYGTPTISNGSTTIRIFEDDRENTIQLERDIYGANESRPGGSNGQVTLTVTASRFGDPRTELRVDYTTRDDVGSAEPGKDYVSQAGTITFGPGETHKQITIDLLNDTSIESGESFRVQLSNPDPDGPGGAVFGTGFQNADVIIGDDDGGTSFIQFTTTEYTAGEGDISAVVTAVRNGGNGFKVSADYSTAAGSATAGQDYQQSAGRIEFESGEYSKAIRITVFQDGITEASENFSITLANPSVNAAIGSPATANVTILDDEGPPVITSPTNASGQRGEPFSYRITATNSPTSYGATGLPAGLSVDTASGLISGRPNDFGAFQVQISASNSKGTGTATLILSIASGETTIVQFRNDFQTVTDPQSSVTLIVDLARAGGESDAEVSVDYATGDGSAKAGVDYEPQAGRLVFAPGQKQQSITIAITPRGSPGPDRTFFVDLSNPSRGMLGRSRATIVSTHPDLSTKLLNISTRAPVRSGEEVMIAGFIVDGSVPKRIVLRAIGPSLTAMEVPNAIQDPTLTLMDANGSQIAFNDNYRQNSVEDRQALENSGLSPTDERESAIVATLAPGSYTAILRGKSNGTGLVEVYDIGGTSSSRFVNIATRSRVNEGDNGAMIAGFIVGAPNQGAGTSQRVILRAIGPSLSDAGIADVLENPTLEIYRGSQKILENDDWKTDQRQELQASGLAPTKDREAAIIADLEPGSYSVVIRGKSNTTGVALAEVYQAGQ